MSVLRRRSEQDNALAYNLIVEFIQEVGHEAVRSFYLFERKLRRELDTREFPILLMYRLSLYRKLRTEYGSLTTDQISQVEGISRRTIYRYRKNYYEKKTGFEPFFVN